VDYACEHGVLRQGVEASHNSQNPALDRNTIAFQTDGSSAYGGSNKGLWSRVFSAGTRRHCPSGGVPRAGTGRPVGAGTA
jgi:hypothetical protein